MKATITKKIATSALIKSVILVCLGSALLVGCQVPGKVVSTKTCSVCPLCKTQTVTCPIKGLTYTRTVCPTCHTEGDFDPEQKEVLRDYVGLSSDLHTVHVCDHCKRVVENCPVCCKHCKK